MKNIVLRLSVFLLGFMLLGCQLDVSVTPTAVSTDTPAAPIVTVSPTAVPATPTLPPTPFITPTPMPTATPSPTPRLPVSLAVPPDWVEQVAGVLAQLDGNSGWVWQWRQSDDPAAELESEQAQIAIVASRTDAAASDDGEVLTTVIRREPLVLAVPFTTEWENSPGQEARRILAEGHGLARAMNWADIPQTHKALRINGHFPTDPDYPFHTTLSLVAVPGYEAAVAEVAPLLQAAVNPEPLVHLVAVGDIMLDRGPGIVLRQGNLAYPFARVAHLFAAADITVGNLECALGDIGQPAPKSYPFRAPPEAAAALALAGFDVVSLANNHAMDYGPEALLQGIGLLHDAGVATIGAGANAATARAPYIQEVNGLRLAFLGYVHVPVEARSGFDTASWTATADAPGLAWAVPEEIREDVAAARAQADLVIVVLHSGYEYVEAPSDPQVAAARAAIDAGAHLVIGHHAHILQGIHFYKGGVIAYGLGNFAFEIDGPPETAILNAWLDQGGVRQLELIPAIIQFGGQPRLAEPWEASAILRQVYRLTTLLNVSAP